MPGGHIADPTARRHPSAMNEVETRLRLRQMPPLHVHEEDEELRVLEGRLTVFAVEGEVELRAGDSWVAPAGVPHTYRAESGRVRVLAITRTRAPGRYEDFLRAVAEPSALSPDDEAALGFLAAATGITVLGAPGAMPR
jgi:quercetin dioxygenase-like cupin family protein